MLLIQARSIAKYILNQLEKAYFQVPLNGLGFTRGARRSPLMCKGLIYLARSNHIRYTRNQKTSIFNDYGDIYMCFLR